MVVRREYENNESRNIEANEILHKGYTIVRVGGDGKSEPLFIEYIDDKE